MQIPYLAVCLCSRQQQPAAAVYVTSSQQPSGSNQTSMQAFHVGSHKHCDSCAFVHHESHATVRAPPATHNAKWGEGGNCPNARDTTELHHGLRLKTQICCRNARGYTTKLASCKGIHRLARERRPAAQEMLFGPGDKIICLLQIIATPTGVT